MSAADQRAAAAERLLAENGLPGAAVTVEGHEREIAAIRAPAGAWERLLGDEGARLAAGVKALGFRYVAVDLEVGEGEQGAAAAADPHPARRADC